MRNTATHFRVWFVAFGIASLALARNDGWRDGSASRARGDTPVFRGNSSSGGQAPAAGATRSFAPPATAGRAAPAASFAPRAVQTPSAVRTVPQVRQPQPVFGSGRSSYAPEAPTVRSTPRITSDSPTPRRQPDTSAFRPSATPNPATPPVAQTSPRFHPGGAPSQPLTPQQPSRPLFQNEGARSYGTERTVQPKSETTVAAPAAGSRTPWGRQTPNPARSDGTLFDGAARRTETPPATPLSGSGAPQSWGRQTPNPARSDGALFDGAARRTDPFGRAGIPRRETPDVRLDTATPRNTTVPARFGTTGLRNNWRGDSGSERFGPAYSPKGRSGSGIFRSDTAARGDKPGAERPGPRDSNRLLSRPSYRPGDRHTQPFHGSHPSYYRGGRHDDHHDDHHRASRHAYCAFSPVWWGPVVYPAGFGLTWYSGSFGLSIATYAPAHTYTRYYDSWCGGGWGYSSAYYGGWRSGWYGGFSYVYNPWPVYRTYYLYDPYPVTETIYVTQPVTETIYVTQPAAATAAVSPAAPSVTTESYAVSAAAAPAAYAAVPAASPSAWDEAPAVSRAEAAATSCFCPCQCNGIRPCTCDYPCGAEYGLRDEEFDLSLGFASYADTLNPETIWSSYAGLDRWEPAEDDGSALFATRTDDAR